MRRYVFDYHAQRRYLTELQRKNERIRERLHQFKRQQEIERLAREETLKEVCVCVCVFVCACDLCCMSYVPYVCTAEVARRRSKKASHDEH